jgi:hypothetical protein
VQGAITYNVGTLTSSQSNTAPSSVLPVQKIMGYAVLLLLIVTDCGFM